MKKWHIVALRLVAALALGLAAAATGQDLLPALADALVTLGGGQPLVGVRE